MLRKLLDDCKDGSEWVCIQGECVAPSVQGNKYHVDKPDLYCFTTIERVRGLTSRIFSVAQEMGLIKDTPLQESSANHQG